MFIQDDNVRYVFLKSLVALLARDDNVRCCFVQSQRYSLYKRGRKSVRAVLHLITANVANDSFNAKFFTIIFSVLIYAL